MHMLFVLSWCLSGNSDLAVDKCFKLVQKTIKLTNCSASESEFETFQSNNALFLECADNHVPNSFYKQMNSKYPELMNVSLINNGIEMIGQKMLSGWSKLRQLRIKESKLTIENSFDIPQSLKEIHLEVGKISKAVVQHLVDKNLEVFNVSNTFIGGRITLMFSKPSIRNLILKNCSLSDLFFMGEQLENLHFLDLSKNCFHDVFQNSLGILYPELRHLNVSYNKITELNLLFTWGMPALEMLDLQHNSIHAIDPHSFKNNPKLRTVDLSANQALNSIIIQKTIGQKNMQVIVRNFISEREHEDEACLVDDFVFYWCSSSSLERECKCPKLNKKIGDLTRIWANISYGSLIFNVILFVTCSTLIIIIIYKFREENPSPQMSFDLDPDYVPTDMADPPKIADEDEESYYCTA